MRILGLFVLFLLTFPCAAQQADRFSFTVLPASPIAGQGFQVRVGLAALSCYPLPSGLPATDLGNNVIRFEVDVPDTCFPFPQQEVAYPVGGLAAGQYTFRYVICPQFLPPIPNSCSTLSEQSVSVSGDASSGSIPTLDGFGRYLLVVAIGLAALIGTRYKTNEA